MERGRIWRYGTSGDLPGRGNRIDHGMLAQLVDANRGKLGYTYSHKPVEPSEDVPAKMAASNRLAIRMACDGGFTISLSADGLCEADRLSRYGLPMVSLVPQSTPEKFVTSRGLHGIVCPAQTHDLTCLQCKLCARPERAKFKPGTPGSPLIGFRPHGGQVKRIEAMVAKEC